MQKLSRTGIGVIANTYALRDDRGTGSLPLQAHSDGATSFRVTGRVSPEAPWMEIMAPGTADFLEAISWCPYVQLEVLSGAGTVDLYIGEV